jgi:hypothetical protein
MTSQAALSNKAQDARSAMCALVESRSLSIREDEPEFPAHVAQIAWLIADAMAAERIRRQGGSR